MRKCREERLMGVILGKDFQEMESSMEIVSFRRGRELDV